MTEENILEVLPSIRLARLFYIYGKWDAFLKIGFMEASDDYCDVFWELIEASADFTAIRSGRIPSSIGAGLLWIICGIK